MESNDVARFQMGETNAKEAFEIITNGRDHKTPRKGEHHFMVR